MQKKNGWIAKRIKESSSSILRAAAVQLVSKYSTIVIGIGSQLVLARLLTPQDYGVLAVMMVFTTFFGMLADFGISGAIVQNQDLDSEDICSIYAWSLRLALILGIGFAFISYPISIFYGNTVYQNLGCILSLSVFFSTLNMVPNALLTKRKLFLLIGLRQITVAFVCAVISIVLAWGGAGVYSLVASSVLSAMINYVWNIKGTGLRLSWHVNKESIRKIRDFSLNVFGFRFVVYFSRNLDNLIVGKILGVVPLGNYNRAYQLMIYPLSMFTGIIMSVLHPFLAEHQKDSNYIYEKFLHAVKILSLCGVFVTAVSFFCADEIVLILFGAQWEEAIPCFRFMSIAIWPQMVTATSGAIFQSINRTELMFRRGILATFTMFCCLGAGIALGSIESVSQFVAINYYLQFITMLYFLIRGGFHKSIRSFVRKLLPDSIIACLLLCSLYLADQLAFVDLYISFGIKLFVALCVFLILLVMFRQYYVFEFLVPQRYRCSFKNVLGRWRR